MNIIYSIKNCIEFGNREELKDLLLKNTEFIDAKYEKNSARSFLHLASEVAESEIIEVLPSIGANPNIQDSNGDAPLHISALKEDLESCKLLIENGANPKIKNNRGSEPFQAALNTKNKELIKYLRSVIYGR